MRGSRYEESNVRAFDRCQFLKEWLASLPEGFFIGGDNAYTVTQKLVTPYRKAEFSDDTHKRTYNYYLSQLRIRIEMAFGRLTTKWRRLRSTLHFANKTNSQIIRVCTKLHNFCIRMDLKDNTYVRPRVSEGNLDELNPGDFGIDPFDGGENRKSKWGYLPSVHEDDEEGNAAPLRYSYLVPPDSARRDEILAEVHSRYMLRPQHNRNRNDDDDSEL